MSAQVWLHPERLAARWREQPPADEPVAAPTDDPIDWCARLCVLGGERFGAESAVARILDELAQQVARRFARQSAPPDDAAALDAVIAELVTAVEDLADAAALGGSRR
jgi:hypothetical protein